MYLKEHESPIRVAFVAPELFPLPPREGFATAVEFVIDEMCEILRQRHRVTIYSIADPAFKDGLSDGVAYKYTPVTTFDTKILPFLYRLVRRTLKRDLDYWQSVGYYALYAIRTARKIGQEKVDIVHLHNILQFAPWIRRFAPQSKIIFHIHWHGLSKKENYFGYEVLRTELAERCLKDVDAVVAVSDYLLDGMRERFPNHAHKLFRVHNGAKEAGNRATFASAPTRISDSQSRDPIIIFTGRMIPEKGLHVLLKAMRIVLEQHPNAQLHVMGKSWRPGATFSDYEQELQRLIEGMEDRIHFLGWRPHSEIPRILANADVYAFPSVWEEPCSTALLEALAAGLPTVATATGGTPELVKDGENGFLVPPDDHVALARRVSMLLDNPELRRQIGERARRLSQEGFSWQRVIEEFEAVYYRTLAYGSGFAGENMFS